jgi:outer membrane lipase/esterase
METLAAEEGLGIILFDAEGLFRDVQASPQAFGLTYFLEPCWTGMAPPCSNPQDYTFLDVVHPTAAAHRIIAKRVAEALQAPSSAAPAWLGAAE